jgi:hypothetical protein
MRSSSLRPEFDVLTEVDAACVFRVSVQMKRFLMGENLPRN